MRHIGILLVTLVITVSVLSVGIVLATPPEDLTVDVRGSATLDPFHIKTRDFNVHLKKSADVLVQEVTFLEGGHTGWHSHPGTPVVIVKKGLVRLTRADGCTSDEFGPGESFVEAPGEVLIVRNVGDGEAETIAIFLASPTGVPVRTDEEAPVDCDG